MWFENIKPHLVRNNIKLHVHNTEAAADPACACGDFQTSAMPPCTHLDPGAATDVRASIRSRHPFLLIYLIFNRKFLLTNVNRHYVTCLGPIIKVQHNQELLMSRTSFLMKFL